MARTNIERTYLETVFPGKLINSEVIMKAVLMGRVLMDIFELEEEDIDIFVGDNDEYKDALLNVISHKLDEIFSAENYPKLNRK